MSGRFVVPSCRAWLLGGEYGSRRRNDRERSKPAFVRRRVWRDQRFEDRFYGRLQSAGAAIDGGLTGGTGAGEISFHCVANDAHSDLDLDRRTVDPVPIYDTHCRIKPVRQGEDRRPRLRFAVAEDLLEYRNGRRPAVARQSLKQTPLRYANRGELSIDVAKRERRQPHVLRDHA